MDYENWYAIIHDDTTKITYQVGPKWSTEIDFDVWLTKNFRDYDDAVNTVWSNPEKE